MSDTFDADDPNDISNLRSLIDTLRKHSPHLRKRPAGDPTGSRLQHGMRFELIDHRRFWPVLAGDLNILGHYALRLSRPIFGFREPWPRRPKLLSLPLISKIEGEIGRKTQRPPPKRRQRASKRKRKT